MEPVSRRLCIEDGRLDIGNQPSSKEQYDMKYPKIAFGLVVAIGLLAVAAGPATAREPRAVTCVAREAGKWENSGCTTPGATGSWETEELTETVEATASGTLIQEDRAEKAAIECSASGTGTAGADGAGAVITIKLEKCSFVSKESGKCEESRPVTSKFLNLPWATKLEEKFNAAKELEVRNVLSSLIKGKEAGLAIECTVLKVIQIVDECTGMFSSTKIRANRAVGSVEGEYEKESEPGECSVSKEKSGFLLGVITGKLRNRKGEFQAAWVLAEALKT
jgi:hypothetical protein